MQLGKNTANRPDIDFGIVLITADDFWSTVPSGDHILCDTQTNSAEW